MPRFKLTQGANRERARLVYDRLDAAYPEAKCSLDHVDPLQLMVATVLSAQCTDVRVNVVTKTLFKEYKTVRDYVEKPREQLEKHIQSCGFYRQKAKNIISACRVIIEKHRGEVPGTLEELVELDGVGRKTANVILGTCFNVPGVVVDTHCRRLSNRLGFTRQQDPAKIEQDLMKIWDKENWSLFSHFMVFHGRAVCAARAPKCSICPINDLCPFPETREGKRIAQ